MSFHLFHINEVYSNADGTVQYIEFVGEQPGQDLWAGHSVTSTNGATPNTYNFLTDLPSSATTGKAVLVATQGYVDLRTADPSLPAPDYVIPNNFLFTTGGTVFVSGMDTLDHGALPTDGTLSLNANGSTGTNSPRNFAGATGTIIISSENMLIPGTLEPDSLTGAGGDDTITGDAGDDTLSGGGGADSVNGGAGDDLITGGAGSDTLDGGGDQDNFILAAVAEFAAGESIVGGAGSDTLFYTGTAAAALMLTASVTGIEQVAISTSLGSPDLGTSGSAAINVDASAVGNALALYGNAGANRLTGTAHADELYGNAGNDTLDGGAGADNLDGGAGNDTLIGGGGADTMSGGADNDLFLIDLSDAYFGDSLSGGAGAQDTLRFTPPGDDQLVLAGVSGVEVVAITDLAGLTTGTLAVDIDASGVSSALVITGNNGNNALTGTGSNDTITGNGGNDSLSGGGGADRLIGGAGNDTLDGGPGNDTMDGGLGNDTFITDAATDAVVEAAAGGTDTIRSPMTRSLALLANVENLALTGGDNVNAAGNAAANVLTGNSGNNALDGAAGNDTLIGNDGNDTLTGGAGIDSLVGGLGNDTYVVDAAGDVIVEDANGDVDTAMASVTYTLSANLRNLTLTGAAAINATGNILSNVLTGNAANNVLTGNEGGDTLLGGLGNDTLIGGAGPDEMYGEGGNDVFLVDNAGEYASVFFDGGADTDTIRFTNITVAETLILANVSNVEAVVVTGTLGHGVSALGFDKALTITGNAGNNVLTGTADFNDTIIGNEGNDSLAGSGGSDRLDGGGGNDTLEGGPGNDTMLGGAGNDLFLVEAAGDVATDSAGADTVMAAASYTLGAASNIENLAMINAGFAGTGNALNNLITGTTGDDTLDGAAGNDTLMGGAGNDELTGGAGADNLQGGTEFDMFLLSSVADYTGDTIDGGGGVGDGLIYTGTTAATLTLTNRVLGLEFVQIMSATGDNSGTAAININAALVAGPLNIFGNTGSNILTGTAFAEFIRGYGGNDSLAGGAGNDTLLGDFGNDTLNGGAGDDSLLGGSNDNLYLLDSLADIARENPGEGADSVRLTVNSTVGGAFTLGTDIENLALLGNQALNVTANDSNNVIVANVGADSVDGMGGADSIAGGAGNDSLVGGAGNDTLDGGVGVDTLTGGTGADTYLVDVAGDVINEDPGADVDTVMAGLTFSLLDPDVENLTLTGTTAINGTGNAGNNVLTGNSGNNVLTGNAGADTLSGGLGNDTLAGGDDDDVLTGGAGVDSLAGSAGTDVILIGAVADFSTTERISGGDHGPDGDSLRYTGTTAATLTLTNFVTGIENVAIADATGNGGGTAAINVNAAAVLNGLYLYGNFGANVLTGTAQADVIDGQGGNDSIFGGAGADAILGWTGNDTLNGGLGNDTMQGDNGSDLYLLDSLADIALELFGGADIDSVRLTVNSTVGGAFTLGTDIENLTLLGNQALNVTANDSNNVIVTNVGADSVDGMGGADSIAGGAGNDSLVGGAGNDTLNGGGGFDTFDGGDGDDTFIFDDQDELEALSDASGTDTIIIESTSAGPIVLPDFIEHLVVQGAVANSLTGNNSSNSITGNAGANFIRGLNGADTLSGGLGNDTLLGYDTVDGDDDENVLIGGAGADRMVGDGGNDLFLLGSTADYTGDTLSGGGSTDTLRYTGTAAATLTLTNRVTGIEAVEIASAAGATTGTAAINVNAAAVTTALNLSGNDGANILTGTNDTVQGDGISGNGGNDILFGGAGSDEMGGGEGNDTLDGGADGDYLGGEGGNDSLAGGAGNDYVVGGAGNDTLFGGAGSDSLYGGDDNDLYIFDSLTGDFASEDSGGSGGTDSVRLTSTQAGGSFTLGDNIENLTWLGTGALTVTGNAANNVIVLNNGADSVDGLGGNDSIFGGAAGDTLNGGAGSDTLNGGAGVDTLTGGTGADTYLVDVAGDVINEDPGADVDTVLAGLTFSLTDADLENLTLTGTGAFNGTGNAGNNVLTGNTGNNVLTGNLGADTLSGGLGNDTLAGGDEADVLTGGAGADHLQGGTGSDLILLGAVADYTGDRIDGGADGDTLRYTGMAAATLTLSALVTNIEVVELAAGTAAININAALVTANGVALTLTGNNGNNTLTGTNHLTFGDILIGGGGADTVNGGAGNDVIRLMSDTDFAAGELVNGGSGTDTIALAGAGQTLDLTAIANNAITGIEVFDLTGAGGNTLVFNASDIAALGLTSVTVNGNAGDAIEPRLGWTAGATAGGSTAYTHAGAPGVTLYVDDDVAFTATVPLASLDGTNGFRLDGMDADDHSGRSVAGAGDVNGDGYADLIVGADLADPGGDSNAGESYVVFGKAAGFGAALDLSALDGTNGFRLDGIDEFDQSGLSVAGAGDVNGDGYADLIVGADLADPGGDSNAGESYVVFGKASGFGAALDLATLNGTNGFRLDGIDAFDRSGYSVAGAGDVNGDGYADLIVGAWGGDPGGNSFAGESYVVFGKGSGFGAALDLAVLDGANGFRLDGINADDLSGFSVAGAGDVNGDGYADLIVGAFLADGGDTNAGESYVVFGKAAGFGAVLDLSVLDGANGFRLDGIDANDYSGFSVAGAGDVNGDGYADLIVGAWGADPGGDSSAGESYVVFGKAAGFGAALDLSVLDGANGFRLDGINAGFSGVSVAGAGDVNGDGYADLIVGANGSNVGGDDSAGESYVVFGKAAGFGAALDLSALDDANGFRLDGINAGDFSGYSVAGAGDVNGDGYADLIVGAFLADGGDTNAGESYVIFGGDFTGIVDLAGTSAANTLTGTGADEILIGGLGNDTLDGAGGADVLKGGAGDDVLVFDSADTLVVDGGSGSDTLLFAGSGQSLDLSAIANNKITGIEGVDLTGTGNNSLTLTMGDVLDLSDFGNTLRVEGGTGDTVNGPDGWTDDGTVVNPGYHTWTNGIATLLVDPDITQNFPG